MKHPNIKVKVVHSQTKKAWNIVATQLGDKFKIARVPYNYDAKCSEMVNTYDKNEAMEHARFIAHCFNNPENVK